MNFQMTTALELPADLTKHLDADCDSTEWLGAVLFRGCRAMGSKKLNLSGLAESTRIELEYAMLQVSRATGAKLMSVKRSVVKEAKLLAAEVA